MDRFQHFEVCKRPDGSLDELGRGAMGVTYHAIDTLLHREVALKVINGRYLENPVARERFKREARAAARLQHENIATVYQFGVEGDGFFYAMEYVRGETVEERLLREGPLAAETAIQLAQQACRALQAAADEGLVHRDIKPSNLMLFEQRGELRLKVIDFGLAKPSQSAAEGLDMTLTMGGFVGTPHFASPEQLEEKELDIRSDLYSLGVTFWYMLSGRPPYSGTFASLVVHHLHSPLPVEALPPVPQEVLRVLEKAMAKNPEDRFSNPREMQLSLENAAAALRTMDSVKETAPPPLPIAAEDLATIEVPTASSNQKHGSAGAAAKSSPLRKFPGLAIGLGGAALLMGGLVYWVAGWQSPTSESSEPKQPATPHETSAALSTSSSASAPAIAPSPTPEPTPAPSPSREERLASALLEAKNREAITSMPEVVDNYLRISSDFPEDRRAIQRLEEIFAPLAKNQAGHPNAIPPDPVLQEASRRAANGGIVQAMVFLGNHLRKVAPSEAAQWYQKAAARENAPAMTRLGLMYSYGEGLSKDPAQAGRLFQKAAALGDIDAKFYLGECLLKPNGDFGLPYDAAQAFRLYQEAAAAGQVRAMRELGYCYDKGIGTVVDEKKALELYEQAHRAGDALATANLGVYHIMGKGGLPKSPEMARNLFKQSAESGHPTGMTFYANCLQEGIGGPEDPAQARDYYFQAAKLGNLEAQKACKKLGIPVP